MHGWETRMLLRHYLERGATRAELSRRFGVDRRTIHRWVSGGQLERDAGEGTQYRARPTVEHKLDPYKGIIEARLEEYPRLSARRLFDEVRGAGYTGGYGRVRDYVRSVRPREPEEAVVRFETPAGRQGQVDFATFKLPWGVAGNCKSPISGNRKLHTWIAGWSAPDQAVGKTNRNGAEHGCTDGRQGCC